MTKLNQVIAIEKGIKSRSYAEMSELHKVSQKSELFSGFVKTYVKKDDDGEDLPSERKVVQFTVKELLDRVARSNSEMIDVTAAKDWTNCVARADVTVDDVVLVRAAPVSFLLFMEKQLSDLRTFVEKLPVLDSAEAWTRDDNSGLSVTGKTSTHRTKKVQRPIVMYDATDKHPAQTQLITEDMLVGFWETVKQSGAMPKPKRDEMLLRVESLIRAVKTAREAANMEDVILESGIGSAIYGYLFSNEAKAQS